MKTILVLSTDPTVKETLQQAEHFKADIKLIEDPNKVFKYIEQTKPDLLMIDFILQEGNGGSICHQVKCSPVTRNLPVILLSDYPELFGFLRKFGCNASVTKPLDLPSLTSTVKDMLKARKGSNETRHRRHHYTTPGATAHH
jgi:CheY-like chemotaxis protein